MSAQKEFDLVIRNGRIVDGTRLPAYYGDIAINDGVIAEIGSVRGQGSREIDAKGLIVAPGFIDIHTHYDAQLNWDPYASQSCWHGITSVIVGLCGFGFAPCRPQDRERAMRRMTRVEAIPYESMALGMRWDWVSQDDYLKSLERAGIGVNVATYIPHSVIRAYVLGEEDTRREQLTPAETAQMQELVRDGFRAGALGLSTDHNLIDRDFDGSRLPSAIATEEEMKALLSVAREFNVGSTEVTPPNLHIGAEEIALLERYADYTGRPVIHSVIIQSNHLPGKWQESLKLLEAANERQRRIFGLAFIHRLGSLFNLLEYNLFDDMPAWNSALACPLEQRIANLRNPEMRRKLQHDVDHHTARVWSGRWDRMKIYQTDLKQYQDRYIAEIAGAEGKTPLDVFCDIAVAEGLRTYFYIEDQLGDDENANAALAQHRYVLPGSSDGGAHCQFISMGKYPTVLLSKIVRDDGAMSLEEAHWRLSHMSAAAVGLEGIGTLQRGMPADIVVYDLDQLAVTPDKPVYENILGGGRRLVEKAVGYRYIIVNGQITFIDGECTGALPGRILRSAAYQPAAAA
jgi:N-acyl-D-aspartate/D-glutamate deacylase